MVRRVVRPIEGLRRVEESCEHSKYSKLSIVGLRKVQEARKGVSGAEELGKPRSVEL